MTAHRVASAALFWTAAAAAAAGIASLARSRLPADGGGFEDLAAVAGGILLLAVAGIGFGASLLALGRRAGAAPRWRVGVAAAGAALAIVAAVHLGRVAYPAAHWTFLAFVALVAIIAAAGLARAPALMRGG